MLDMAKVWCGIYMHLLITILQDVCEHELVCNTPIIVCHQDLKRIISAALGIRSFRTHALSSHTISYPRP